MPHTSSDVTKTLCYADIFDYPLTAQELERFLITSKPHKISPSTKRAYYTLPGRETIINLRKKRAAIAVKKHALAAQLIQLLTHIPMIQGIFITGALSMDNVEADDDIDLMIITTKNTLWLTRLLVTILLTLSGCRRYPGQSHAANKLCTNLYLDETALAVPKKNRNLYTAHEVAQAKPIFVRNHVDRRFLAANAWINDFLPNIPIPKISPRILHTAYYILLTPLEILAYYLQRAYMARHHTREHVSPHFAFFHPRNTAGWVIKAYEERIKKFVNHKS